MDYSEALQYLYDAAPAFHLVGAAAYKPGLDNVRALMEQFGNPHTKFNVFGLSMWQERTVRARPRI